MVGEAHSGEQVLPLVRSLSPDVVLLDMRLPKVDGLACLDLIRKHHPTVKVVMFRPRAIPGEIEGAITQGCTCRTSSRRSTRRTLQPCSVRRWTRPSTRRRRATSISKSQEHDELTDRERMILAAVMRGLPNKAISKELWVTEKTVKFHLSNIYRKLGVPNRTAAVRFAQEHGLIDAAVADPRASVVA